MSDEDLVTSAAQHITQGDFMGAMALFESLVDTNPDDPAGYHGWAEAALFEIQNNGNTDDSGNDRILEVRADGSIVREFTHMDDDPNSVLRNPTSIFVFSPAPGPEPESEEEEEEE